jgi:asparagine synthase (glutamine-hydrolysing)
LKNWYICIALWILREINLSGDRLGIKPLYYSKVKDQLIFGSEIKAILECKELQREIDFQALDSFLTYTYIPAPLTIFRGIYKLKPGHMLICTDQNIQIQKYWDIDFEPDKKKTEKQFSEEFLRIFENTVQAHLMSEVPLGVFLSGGIDSSLVTAFMKRENRALETFTIGFGGNIGAHDDERKYARLVSGRYKTNHTEFEVLSDLTGILDKIILALDEPLSDDGIIYYISKLAREGQVGLTGLGGDEMLQAMSAIYFYLDSFYEKSFIRHKFILPVINISEPQNGKTKQRLKDCEVIRE